MLEGNKNSVGGREEEEEKVLKGVVVEGGIVEELIEEGEGDEEEEDAKRSELNIEAKEFVPNEQLQKEMHEKEKTQ